MQENTFDFYHFYNQSIFKMKCNTNICKIVLVNELILKCDGYVATTIEITTTTEIIISTVVENKFQT